MTALHRRTAALFAPLAPLAPLALGALVAGWAPVQAQTLLWTDKEYAAAGLPNPLPAAVVVRAVAGAGPKSFGGDLTVDGTLLWDTAESADFTAAGSVLRNNGRVEFTGDGWLKALAPGISLRNAGTLRKSGGSGDLLIDLQLDNRSGGTLDAGSGALRYRGGAVFAVDTVFAGSGRHVFEAPGAFVFGGSFSAAADKLHFARGTFVNGTAGWQPLDLSAGLQWSGGTLQGAWRNAPGRTVTVLDGLDKAIASNFENQGTLVWNSTQRLTLTASPQFATQLLNLGVLDFGADSLVTSTDPRSLLFNDGTLRKSGGSGELLINVFVDSYSSAVFEAGAGTIRYQRGGQFTGSGPTFSGSGWHVFDGSQTFVFNPIKVDKGRLHFAGGRFEMRGPTGYTVAADLLWSGGGFFGDGGIADGHTMTVIDGRDKFIGNRFINNGTVAWRSSAELGLADAGTVLRNNGLFEFAGDGRIRPLDSSARFDNAGSLRKAGGNGELVLGAFLLNRSGALLDAGSGSIVYSANGTLEAGSVLGGAGRHAFNTAGSYTFGGAFTANDRLRFERGSFVNGGATRLDPLSDVTWTGGVLQGHWGNAAGRRLTVGDGFDKVFAGNFSNDGHVAWSTSGTTNFSVAGTTLQNNGEFDFATNGWLRPLAGTVTFRNAGVLRKLGGSGELLVDTALVNTGAIEVFAGTIVLPELWRNDGALRGSGTFRNQRIDNTGDIAPGLPGGAGSIATLRIDGRLDNAKDSSLSIDVGPGGVSDLLLVTGEARLGGVLRVSAADGYRPVLGDSFHVMSFASASGQFTDVLELGFWPEVGFTAVLSATRLDLRVTAVPEPPGWLLLIAGLAGILMWRRWPLSPPTAR